MESKKKEIIRGKVAATLRFIFRQLNKLARKRWITPTFGDVADVFGKGPCERCVGRMVSKYLTDDPFGEKTGHIEVLNNLEYLELQSIRGERKAKRKSK